MEFFYYLARGLFGLVVLIGIAWLFSTNRKAIDWRLVGVGVVLQIVFGLFILKTAIGRDFFAFIGGVFRTVLNYTFEGSAFIFGSLGIPPGSEGSFGNIIAFQVLPTIIFFASLMSVLYYIGLIQPLVRGMGWVMAKSLNISGAEALSAAANVFVGQTEAPLVVKPYVSGMTRSELMTLMAGGMATIAGGVLAAYVVFLGGDDIAAQARFAGHLLSASIMSAPASIVLAKVLIPETETPTTLGSVDMGVEQTDSNLIEAAASGAAEGLKLALNVGAMLLAFIALIALVNGVLGWFGNPLVFGLEPWNLNAVVASLSNGRFESLSLQAIFGFAFAPLAWAMGVETADILTFGALLGEKIAVNEFVAFASLSEAKLIMSERSVIIGTYALCGFANFGSIAIQIGGIGGIAPDRKSEIAQLGLRAVLGGALASWMTATVAGMLI